MSAFLRKKNWLQFTMLVSSLLNERYSNSLKKACFTAIPGKGVFVGTASQKAVHQQSQIDSSIGVIITDLTSPFYSAVLQAVELEAARQNYFVIFSNIGSTVPDETQQISRFRKVGVKGFIVASRRHNLGVQPPMVDLLRGGIPTVFVSYVPDSNASYIGTDHRLGGFLATEHLIKLGYKRIAYATPDPGSPLSQLRFRGYVDALTDYGFSQDDVTVIGFDKEKNRNRFEVGYELGRTLSEQKNLPEAIFAYSDLTALGLKRAFIEAGLRIPEDIALVGFDDIPMANQSIVPLTTIRQPVDQIGSLAFDTLRRKIDGDHSVTRIALMPELVVRESCGGKTKKLSS